MASSQTLSICAILGFLLASIFVGDARAACFEETTPWTRQLPIRRDLFPSEVLDELNRKVSAIGEDPQFENVSFSISATTLNETFWSYHHTASHLDHDRPGANPVTGDSFYRIASITKMFTTTAILQLHAQGKLHLDDSVQKYLPQLAGPMPWQDITIRMLVSQSSGLGRDWSQGDLTRGVPNMIDKGFPPPTKKYLPKCYEQSDFIVACNETDLYNAMPHQRPVFAPNQVGSYSNAAFELLGMVIENATGSAYTDIVNQNILEAWSLSSGVTFEVPADNVAVLPKNMSWFFGIDIGIHAPAGALYATTNGLDAYLRNMMLRGSKPEIGAPAVNIFMPESYSFGSSSSYGLTWEVFRTGKMLDSGRPLTFFTKGGGHPGYITIIMALPEYGMGMTILCAGDKAGKALDAVREVVAVKLVQAAEQVSSTELKRKYSGRFTFDEFVGDTVDNTGLVSAKLNSSLKLAHDSVQGLYIQAWVSNGTDMLTTLDEIFSPGDRGVFTYRLVATGLDSEDKRQRKGEIWRAIPLLKKRNDSLWADFCVNDVDGLHFDGKPFLEFVFYEDAAVVEIPSFRVRLSRSSGERELVLQETKAGQGPLIFEEQSPASP